MWTCRLHRFAVGLGVQHTPSVHHLGSSVVQVFAMDNMHLGHELSSPLASHSYGVGAGTSRLLFLPFEREPVSG